MLTLYAFKSPKLNLKKSVINVSKEIILNMHGSRDRHVRKINWGVNTIDSSF
jgi:hypothetical protein